MIQMQDLLEYLRHSLGCKMLRVLGYTLIGLDKIAVEKKIQMRMLLYRTLFKRDNVYIGLKLEESEFKRKAFLNWNFWLNELMVVVIQFHVIDIK